MPLDGVIDLWPGPDLRALTAEVSQPLPVPCTAMFTRSDGVVNWESCVDEAADMVEIDGPHALIQTNPRVFEVAARVLARAAG